MRRWTAISATVLLVLEAGVSLLAALLLGAVAHKQHMQFAGVSYTAIANGAYVGLGLQTAFLLLVAGVLVRVAVRAQDRPFGRPTRFALIAAAVFHGVLAALMLALSGVWTFLVVAVTLTLLVLLFFTPTRPEPGAEREPSPAPVLPAS
jgi:cytochrome b561